MRGVGNVRAGGSWAAPGGRRWWVGRRGKILLLGSPLELSSIFMSGLGKTYKGGGGGKGHNKESLEIKNLKGKKPQKKKFPPYNRQRPGSPPPTPRGRGGMNTTHLNKRAPPPPLLIICQENNYDKNICTNSYFFFLVGMRGRAGGVVVGL